MDGCEIEHTILLAPLLEARADFNLIA